jgi:hypothetical protein
MAGGGGGGGAAAAPNVAFVTARGWVGNFGGTAFADGFCQASAIDAGLPGTYRAWLSSTDGGAALSRLAGARGWVRVDGRPFADSLDALAGRLELFYPNELDERGARIFGFGCAWTGTLTDGGFAGTGSSCRDWSSNGFTEGGLSGELRTAGRTWTARNRSCSLASCSLYCMGIDRSAVVRPSRPAGARLAFVSQPFVLDGGALAAADDRCAREAAGAGHPGSYRALLATGGTPASARFALDAGPWTRIDGVQLALTAADFVDNRATRRLAPLNVTADGGYLAAGPVWTGSAAPSDAGTTHCSDWTSSAAGQSAFVGEATQGNAEWFNAGTMSCSDAGHVYCLQE